MRTALALVAACVAAAAASDRADRSLFFDFVRDAGDSSPSGGFWTTAPPVAVSLLSRASMDAVDTLGNASTGAWRDPATGAYANGFTSQLYPQYHRSQAWQVMTGAGGGTIIIPSLVVTDSSDGATAARAHPDVTALRCGDWTGNATSASGWWSSYAPCGAIGSWFAVDAVPVLSRTAGAAGRELWPSAGRVSWSASSVVVSLAAGAPAGLPEPPAAALTWVDAPPAAPKAAAPLPLTLTLRSGNGATTEVLVTVQVVPAVQPALPEPQRELYGGLDADGAFPLALTPGYVDVHWVASPAGSSAAAAAQPKTVHVDVAVPAGGADWLLYRAVEEPGWSSVTIGAPEARTVGDKTAMVTRIAVEVDGAGLPAGFSNHITLAMTPNVTGVDGSGIIVGVDGSITVETLPPTPLSFTVQLTVLSSVAAPDESALFTSLVPEGNTSRILRLFNTGLLPMDYRLRVVNPNSLVGRTANSWLEMRAAVDFATGIGYGLVQPFSEVRIPLDVVAPGNSTAQFSTVLDFDVGAHFLGTDGVDASARDGAGAIGAALVPQLDSVNTPEPLPSASGMRLSIPVDLQVSLYTIWPQEAVFTLSPESSDVVIFELLNMAPIYNLDLTITRERDAPEWLSILLPRADGAGRRKVQLTTDGRLSSLWLEAANFPGATGQERPNHLLSPGTYTSEVHITSTIRPDSPGYGNLATTPGLGSEVRTIPVTLEVVVGTAAPQTTELRPDRDLNPTYKIIANDVGPHQLRLVLRDRYGHGPPVPTIPEVTLLTPADANAVGVGDIDIVVQPVEDGNVVIDVIAKRVGRVAVEVSIDGAPVEGHVRSPILVEVMPAQCNVAGPGDDPRDFPHVLSADQMECLCAAGWERVNLGTSNETDFSAELAADASFIVPQSGVPHGGVTCQACREGYFKSVEGNTIRCTACGDGKFSRSDRQGCSDCPAEGVRCVAGNLRLEDGFWCESCLAEEDVTETMLVSLRRQGNASIVASSGSRRLQTADADSDAELLTSLSEAEVGTATAFHNCIPEEACRADGNGTSVVCITGHSGILCSECEEGWAKSNPQGLCAECWPTGASVGLSAALFVVMFMLVCYIALKKPSTGDNLTTALLRIASTWAQLASLLLTARLPPRSILDDVIIVLGDVAGGVPLQSNPIQCTFGDVLGFYRRFYLFLSLPFICLAMGLVLGSGYLLFRLATRKPAATRGKLATDANGSLESARSDVDIDDAAAPVTAAATSPPGGAAPVGEPGASADQIPEAGAEPAAGAAAGARPTVVPPTGSAAEAAALATPARATTAVDAPVDEGEPTMWAAVRQKASRATLVLLFLAHFSVTKATLLVLDTFDEPLFGFIRFRSDLRHGEFDDEFAGAQSLAMVGLLFFGMGLPVAAGVLLNYYRYDLNRSHTRNTFGFLYMGYKLGPGTRLGSARAATVLGEVEENDEWARYRPRTCGWLWTWLLGDEVDELSDDEGEVGEVVHATLATSGAGESKAEEPGAETDDEDDDPTPAGGVASKTGAIITEAEAAALNNTGYWSWEVIIVARKILMTSVSVTVRAPFTQSALMVMILTASLCLHVSQTPYASTLLNSAETMALIVLWISAMSGVVLYEEGELTDDTAETVRGIIVFANLMLMMYFSFILLYALSAAVRGWATRQYHAVLSNFAKMGGDADAMSPLSPFKSGWGSSMIASPEKSEPGEGGGPLGPTVEEGFSPDQLKAPPTVMEGEPGESKAEEVPEEASKKAAPSPEVGAGAAAAAAAGEDVVEDEVEDVVVPIKTRA